MRSAIAVLVIFLFASCAGPPSDVCEERLVSVAVPLSKTMLNQWELSFSVGFDATDFLICTDNMYEWPDVSSLALIRRTDGRTIILAAQTGTGDLCIDPTDGALDDIVLENGVYYTVAMITGFNTPEILIMIPVAPGVRQ